MLLNAFQFGRDHQCANGLFAWIEFDFLLLAFLQIKVLRYTETVQVRCVRVRDRFPESSCGIRANKHAYEALMRRLREGYPDFDRADGSFFSSKSRPPTQITSLALGTGSFLELQYAGSGSICA